MQYGVLDTITQLVAYKTTADNPTELLRCADYIQQFFSGYNVYLRTFINNNIPSILVTLHDTTEPEILLSSHFDVVPGSDELFEAKIAENRIMGRGVYDDKGPLALHMHLLRELSMTSDPPNIGLLTTGDEEIGGENGAGYVLTQGVSADFAIIHDGGGLNEFTTKAKGAIHARIISEGMSSHGSRPWEGINAIDQLMRVYKNIQTLFPFDEDSYWRRTLNAGKIIGGEAVNNVPDYAELAIDIRLTEHDSPHELLAEIQHICEEEGDVRIEIDALIPSYHSDQNHPVLQDYMQLSSEAFGESAQYGVDFGGSDARFFMKHGIPSVVTCPHGGGHHSDEEFLDTNTLEQFYTVLKRLCTQENRVPEEFQEL